MKKGEKEKVKKVSKKIKENSQKKERLWKTIATPTIILIAYSIAIILLETFVKSITLSQIKFISFTTSFVQLICFSYIGFKVSKNKEKKSKEAFLYGLTSGIMLGIVLTIAFSFVVYSNQELYISIIEEILATSGLVMENMGLILKAFVFVEGALNIIFLGLFGGVVSWISRFIFLKQECREEIKSKKNSVDKKKVVAKGKKKVSKKK